MVYLRIRVKNQKNPESALKIKGAQENVGQQILVFLSVYDTLSRYRESAGRMAYANLIKRRHIQVNDLHLFDCLNF